MTTLELRGPYSEQENQDALRALPAHLKAMHFAQQMIRRTIEQHAIKQPGMPLETYETQVINDWLAFCTDVTAIDGITEPDKRAAIEQEIALRADEFDAYLADGLL